MKADAYHRAQTAMADLKGSVLSLLEQNIEGMSNAAIGRSLGIYGGHKGHEGHIPRTLLAMLEQEGVVQQNPGNQLWTVRQHGPSTKQTAAGDTFGDTQTK
jgi:hypothetical protein